MHKRLLWSRILCIVGAGMIVIAPAVFFLLYWRYAWSNESGIDWVFWLMQVLLLLPLFGSGLAALGAFLGKSHYRKFPYVAFLLTICGLITAYGLVATGLDLPGPWWSLCAACAYFIGPVMSCAGAVLAIIESFHRSPVPQDSADAT